MITIVSSTIDASSRPSSASKLEENTDVISAEIIGLDCWEERAERTQVVVSDGDVSKLPETDVDHLCQTAAAMAEQDLRKIEMTQPEANYKVQIMRLLSAWIEQHKPTITVNGKAYELLIGKKREAESTVWETNMRKCRISLSESDLLLYFVNDDGRRIVVGVMVTNSGNGSSPTTDPSVRTTIQQAVCDAIAYQRPLMSRAPSFRLPVLVLYEDCAFWVSLTTDDALVYPYSIMVRRYMFGELNRDDVAVRVAVTYLRSVLEPGLYDADEGFQKDTSHLSLSTSHLEFPPVGDSRIRRSEWANNIFRCEFSTALSTGYLVNPEFENQVIKTTVASQPVVIKVVSSVCYDMQNSTRFILRFLEDVAWKVQAMSAESANRAVRDAVRQPTDKLLQLRVSGSGPSANELVEALSSVYN